MKSRMEIAKDIFGNRSSASAGYHPGATSSSVGSVTGGGTSASGSATLRQARVESINDDGTVTLTMLDTGDQVRVMTTTPVSVGQIVNVIKQGSNVVIYSLEGVVGQQVTAVMTQYAGSDSESEPPAETAMWASVWPEGYGYVWQRVVTEYKDGTRSISEVTCISRPSEGADLSGVVTDVKIQYAGNNNPNSAPAAGWSDEMPEGYECTWQRTATTFGDGHVEYSEGALIKQDTGEDQMQTVYATSSTSASSAAKVATVQSGTISLVEGAVVQVTFTYQNTAPSPSLNVGGAGARQIRTLGTPYAYWAAGATVLFVYDGTYWQTASVPVYASIVTIGNPLATNMYLTQSGMYHREGSTNTAAFLPNRIDLGLSSDVSEITLLQQMFAIRARDLGSSSQNANYLSIQPYDFGSSGSTRGINIQVDNDTYLLVGDSSEIGSRAAVLQSLNNARVEGMDDCYFVAGGNAIIKGNSEIHRAVAIYKPGVTVGSSSSIALSSTNRVLTASTTYAESTWESSSEYTRIYRSGNYVYVVVPAAPYGKSSETVCVEVSAMARADGVADTNFALELHMDGSGIISDYGGSIGSPIHTTIGMQFTGGWVTPCLVELQQPGYGSSSRSYRFWCEARSSNGTGDITQWYMTVRMI